MSHKMEPFSSNTIVQKRVFTLPHLELESGETLTDVNIGYECYGTLNEKKDNAVFIAHYFSGTSHAAGRYAESDVEPGYWDTIIGSGKAIDTDHFFVIAADSIANLNTGNPQVVTTGPKSINPKTGAAYGSAFPTVRLTDTVRAHYSLCRSLGIETLHAVCGPSMGSMQALEWAALFGDRVKRVFGAIGGGLAIEPYLISLLDQWVMPIRLNREEGLVASLELVTINALSPNWAHNMFKRRPFAITEALREVARTRAAIADADSFLRLADAVRNFSVRENAKNISAKILWIPCRSDSLIFPEFAERGVAEMKALGLNVELEWLETDGGHLDGLSQLAQLAPTIRRFLE